MSWHNAQLDSFQDPEALQSQTSYLMLTHHGTLKINRLTDDLIRQTITSSNPGKMLHLLKNKDCLWVEMYDSKKNFDDNISFDGIFRHFRNSTKNVDRWVCELCAWGYCCCGSDAANLWDQCVKRLLIHFHGSLQSLQIFIVFFLCLWKLLKFT